MKDEINVFEAFGNIAKSIELAEQVGKVDLEILEPLKIVYSEFEKISDHWLDSDYDEQFEDVFPLYHMSRNCKLVLYKMIQRFELAPSVKDDPKVASDASMVLPLLIDMFNVLEECKSGAMAVNESRGFDRTRNLRKIAKEVNMLSDGFDDIKTIPADVKKKGYEVFANFIVGAVAIGQERYLKRYDYLLGINKK